jgi:hypothetical protein
MRGRLLVVIAAILVVRLTTAAAEADEIRIVVPAFEGGALGNNVATVLNLKLWRTLRVPPPNSQLYRPGGKVLWSVETLPKNSHEEAERCAKNNNAQMILWGSATKFGEGALVQSFLSIPRYEDLRKEYPEVWSVKFPCNDFTIDLAVTLPRRRYEFSPISLERELIDRYSVPSSLKLYLSKGGQTPIGELGNSYTALRHEGDYTEVVSQTGRKGWVNLPRLDSEVEIINFAGGLVRLFRADYSGSIDLLQKLSESGAGTSLKFDALLLQAIAKAKQGQDPSALIDDAITLNPHLQAGIKFKITSLASKYVASSKAPETRKAITTQFQRIIAENEYLFSSDDEWMAAARKALGYMLEHSRDGQGK